MRSITSRSCEIDLRHPPEIARAKLLTDRAGGASLRVKVAATRIVEGRRMRRIATWMFLLVLFVGGAGCQSIHAPWAKTTIEQPDQPLEEPEVRTSRHAVSDAVMLRDQSRGGYADSPVGP